jgi:hypothetical protein
LTFKLPADKKTEWSPAAIVRFVGDCIKGGGELNLEVRTYSIIRGTGDGEWEEIVESGLDLEPRARKQSDGASENVSSIRQRRAGPAIFSTANWKAPFASRNSRGKHVERQGLESARHKIADEEPRAPEQHRKASGSQMGLCLTPVPQHLLLLTQKFACWRNPRLLPEKRDRLSSLAQLSWRSQRYRHALPFQTNEAFSPEVT